MSIEKRLNLKQAQEEAERIKNLAGEITGHESNPYSKEEYEEASEWLEAFEQGIVPEKVTTDEIQLLTRKNLQNFGREALIKIYDHLSPKKSLNERFGQLPKTVQRKFLSPQTHQFTEDFIIEQIAELLKLAREKQREKKHRKPTPKAHEEQTDAEAEEEYQKTRQVYLEKWEKAKKPLLTLTQEDQLKLLNKKVKDKKTTESLESEGTFVEICKQSNPPLFGEGSKTYFSSEYDDEFHGSDLYIALTNNIILSLDFTTSTSSRAIEEKLRNYLKNPFVRPKYPTNEDLLKENTQDKNFIRLTIGLTVNQIENDSKALYQNEKIELGLHSYYEIYEQILGQLELMQRVEIKKPETKRNLEPINKALEYFQKLKTKMGLDHPEELGITEDPTFNNLKRPDEYRYSMVA